MLYAVARESLSLWRSEERETVRRGFWATYARLWGTRVKFPSESLRAREIGWWELRFLFFLHFGSGEVKSSFFPPPPPPLRDAASRS